MLSPMKRLALLGIALALTTGSALAASSTPVICGASGCGSLPTATLQGLLSLPEALAVAAPPPVQPFFIFRVRAPGDVPRTVFYVQRETGAFLRFQGAAGWRRVPIDDAKLLVDAAAGTSPYKAPTLRDGRNNGDSGGAYADLLRIHERDAALPPPAGRSYSLVVTPDRPNPWFAKKQKLTYYPDDDVVEIDGDAYRVSAATSDRLRTVLRAEPSRSKDRSGAWIAVGVLIGASALVVAGTERRRRRNRQPPA